MLISCPYEQSFFFPPSGENSRIGIFIFATETLNTENLMILRNLQYWPTFLVCFAYLSVFYFLVHPCILSCYGFPDLQVHLTFFHLLHNRTPQGSLCSLSRSYLLQVNAALRWILFFPDLSISSMILRLQNKQDNSRRKTSNSLP